MPGQRTCASAHHGVDLSADRWIRRLQVVSSVRGAELLDHVD
jgi:hypothetical protein